MQIIEPGKIAQDYWINLWKRRELIYFLCRRDLTVRYKQTFVGMSWVAIKPFLTMVVFTTIFGSLAGMDSKGLPYGFIVFAGVLPWYLFASTLSDTSNCLASNAGLLTKIYFPRLVFPITIFFVGVVDFFVSFLLIIGMMIWYNIMPSWQIIFFPLFIFLAGIFGLGLGMIFAALNVKFRDFQQIIPFALQMGIYVSPVGYLNQVVPKKWEFIYSLNPLSGVINGFRWCLSPKLLTPYWPGVITSATIILLLFFVGVRFFRSGEAKFADSV